VLCRRTAGFLIESRRRGPNAVDQLVLAAMQVVRFRLNGCEMLDHQKTGAALL
jgi:hypothetical protein